MAEAGGHACLLRRQLYRKRAGRSVLCRLRIADKPRKKEFYPPRSGRCGNFPYDMRQQGQKDRQSACHPPCAGIPRLFHPIRQGVRRRYGNADQTEKGGQKAVLTGQRPALLHPYRAGAAWVEKILYRHCLFGGIRLRQARSQAFRGVFDQVRT